jgi:GH25 family lysozyme M1 (1,4-beta-N-acetylmuramidase)
MNLETLNLEILRNNGTILETLHEGTVQLIKLDDIEYVILCDNSIITREEDNNLGAENAYFPYTYNVYFNDSENANDIGGKNTLEYCYSVIDLKRSQYFDDYKNGTVSIVCNETEKTIFEKSI